MSNLLSSASEWIGLGSRDIQIANAGENRCSEKKDTHGVAPEPGAFSFLSRKLNGLPEQFN
jgi:hypothetical protein